MSRSDVVQERLNRKSRALTDFMDRDVCRPAADVDDHDFIADTDQISVVIRG